MEAIEEGRLSEIDTAKKTKLQQSEAPERRKKRLKDMSACQAANIRYTHDMHRQKHISCILYIDVHSHSYVFFQMHACMIALPLYSKHTVCNY
jgi:hypothetical protein